ncbi:ferredoxin [Microbacterium phyllosphaerae]|uniref:ferredoxin n=1 Tax=Microbacterium phyllosphaerae TaxID=124798 RepID=UPI000EA0C95B|nr:ferredoxin [Microbacterium phyllosphaerae]
MRIDIDWGLCEGNGACALEAPDVFEMDDDDNLLVHEESISSTSQARLEAAARSCPKRAITVQP